MQKSKSRIAVVAALAFAAAPILSAAAQVKPASQPNAFVLQTQGSCVLGQTGPKQIITGTKYALVSPGMIRTWCSKDPVRLCDAYYGTTASGSAPCPASPPPPPRPPCQVVWKWDKLNEWDAQFSRWLADKHPWLEPKAVTAGLNSVGQFAMDNLPGLRGFVDSTQGALAGLDLGDRALVVLAVTGLFSAIGGVAGLSVAPEAIYWLTAVRTAPVFADLAISPNLCD